MKRTRLGTESLKFDILTIPRGSPVYGTIVGGVTYRITTESPGKPPEGQKWRLDRREMGIWEALTPEGYGTPEAAAQILSARV